ncbi:MAG TPA: hypothetical protein PK992_04765 [Planctomycetaceae bacterium]|nr:hypothetical protein [Planctomycetaceae bacterium]
MLHETALLAALSAFERALEEPLIPGELQSWCVFAREGCSDAVSSLEKCIPTRHAQLLNEIDGQALELSARVEQLRAADSELLVMARELQVDADRLGVDAELSTSQESKIGFEVQSFIDAGLAWIIRTRKQEAALTAWFQEAFNRDRGTGD